MSFFINPYVFAVGGGGFPPADIADMWGGWEPSRETGLSNNDPMPDLTDQSGNARHWSQATEAERPIYTTNILNGHAVSDHAGDATIPVYHFWSGPDMSSLTAAHIFMVVKFDFDCPGTTSKTGGWKYGTANDTDHHPYADCNWYDGSFSNVRKSTGNPSPDTSQWRVVEIISVSGEWTILFDGTQHFTTATNTVAGRVTPYFGRTNGSGGDAFAGQMAGIYLFSAKKTGADRTTLIDYINDRFALSSS